MNTRLAAVSDAPGAPFRVDIAQDRLDDMTCRLRATRFPTQQIAPDWRFGTPLAYARALRDHWVQKFDWREWERRINQFEQRIVELDGHPIHVLFEYGSGTRPMPLLLTHGWPGSFLEFLHLIEPLAHPERFGGNAEDGFTVIVPSLPGSGFSAAPAQPMAPKEIARLWNLLMTEYFCFERYAAQGGDWGGLITSSLALYHPDKLVAIHLNMSGIQPHLGENSPPLRRRSNSGPAVRLQRWNPKAANR